MSGTFKRKKNKDEKIKLKNIIMKKCKGKHRGSFFFPLFFLSLLSFFFIYVSLKKPTGLTLGTDLCPVQKLMILCLWARTDKHGLVRMNPAGLSGPARFCKHSKCFSRVQTSLTNLAPKIVWPRERKSDNYYY